MPLLSLHTSVPVPPDAREPLLKTLSRIVAETVGKPETYVMVTLSEGAVCLAGEEVNGAFVDVRSIGGLNPEVNRRISEQVCLLLLDRLQIPQERVYLNFRDVAHTDWGHDGRTF